MPVYIQKGCKHIGESCCKEIMKILPIVVVKGGNGVLHEPLIQFLERKAFSFEV